MVILPLVISILVFVGGMLIYLVLKGGKDIFPNGTFETVPIGTKILKIHIPQNNEKYITAAYNFLLSLHGLTKSFDKVPIISLEMLTRDQNGVEFYIKSTEDVLEYIKNQLYAQYPSANIELVNDYAEKLDSSTSHDYLSGTQLILENPFVYPIRTLQDFDRDPMASIAGAMENLYPGESIYIQYVIRPYPDVWQKTAYKYIEEIKAGKKPELTKKHNPFITGILAVLGVFANLFSGPSYSDAKDGIKLEKHVEEQLRYIEEKTKQPAFQVNIRILAKSTTSERSLQLLEGVIAVYQQFSLPHLNSIAIDNSVTVASILDAFKQRYLPIEEENMILNISEVSTLYHLPQIDPNTRFLYKVTATKLPPPNNLPVKQGTIFGITDYRGKHLPFGIKQEDLNRHMYIIGKSGTGKSTLLKNMIIGEILQGHGIALIDPHGDLAEEVLEYIPERRIEDVIYFNPADSEFPIGFNPIQVKGDDKRQRDIIADSIVGVFKKVFTSWGPRLEYLLYNSIITVLESQGTTLLSIQRILVDKKYRKQVLSHVKDKAIHNFWQTEFAQMEQNKKLITEAISPIQNKIGRFLSPKIIRNILGQVRSKINMRKMMDEQKIFIVNLSKGQIGEDNATLLGGLLITRLYSSALERANIPEAERVPFSLYIDEVQSFTTDAFTSIFSEARKYKMSLIMAHQFLDQLEDSITDAIFGNVGTLLAFNIGQEDAFRLSREFSPFLKPDDFLLLNRYEFYTKMMINNQTSQPFSAKSLPMIYNPYNLKNEIISYTRSTYCVPRDVIEEKLDKWISS